MELYQQRENLRNEIKTFWKEGRTWTDVERQVSEKLNQIHAEIVKMEMLDETKSKERFLFSVCGWSEKHGYFRNKRFKASTIKEAIAELQIAKKEDDWKIPTVIVKETYYRQNSPAMVDFDGDVNDLGFSNNQEVIDKNMCGNRSFRWNDLISPNDDRFTY